MTGNLHLTATERLELRALLQRLEAERQPVDYSDPDRLGRTFEHGLRTDAVREADRWHELLTQILSRSTSA